MTQETALAILKTGANVFLTGEPGAGKTYVVNQYTNWLEISGVSVAITASTGIAATHIGGLTIHSWSGIGARDDLTRADLDKIASTEYVVRRIKKTKVLIIDEISMLDGKLLDMVDVVCRTIKMSTEAFGGIQVVCVGDFFQLPPIVRNGDITRYAFESRAWENLKPLICYLTEQHRQEDELLSGLLHSIRAGEIEEEHFSLLKEQTDIAFPDIEPTKLYTHNLDVDTVNSKKLSELSHSKRSFKMTGGGNKILQESLVRNCLSPNLLELKIDAMVMCTKNNFEAGYANGTLGRVVDFEAYDGFPVIETLEGKRITVEPASWDIMEDKKTLASIEQIPLRLAWAITVHKSQGMSLDAAEMDLSRAFVYGQGYVALSRVRSLSGLKVLGMSDQALRVDPKIINTNDRFLAESEAAEDTFRNMDDNELKLMHENFVKASGGKVVDEKTLANLEKDQKTTKVKVVKEKMSTYAETLRLIKQGETLSEIAKNRELTTSTIISHIEKLFNDGDLDENFIEEILKRDYAWPKDKAEIFSVFKKVGPEVLRPVFDELKGEKDYTVIRLARMLFAGKNSEKNQVKKTNPKQTKAKGKTTTTEIEEIW